ncbi:hypothetical protein [Agarivorans sp. QJM3NY_25]
MNKLKNALQTKRFWFGIGAVGTAIATGQVNQSTVGAVVDLFSIFTGA